MYNKKLSCTPDCAHVQENQGLVQPLTVALAREAELQDRLKHQAQTRAALHHAKVSRLDWRRRRDGTVCPNPISIFLSCQGRLRFLRKQQGLLEQGNAEAERALAALEQERDGLRQSFEACLRRLREENDRRSARLEARLEELAVTGGGGGSGPESSPRPPSSSSHA